MRAFKGLAGGLALAVLSACHSHPALFQGGTLPLGKEILVLPGSYNWVLPAQPGESYHVRAEWPAGRLELKVGSDHRGLSRDDEDDADSTESKPGEALGSHGQEATWRAGAKADTLWIKVHTLGFGTDPIRLRLDRLP